MSNLFLNKYKEYCRGHDLKGDDIFKMSQMEDETLEDYVAQFMFNLKRNTQHQLNEESHKHLFLKGVHDKSMEALDLMARGDITQKMWAKIWNICLNYSRATIKKGWGVRDLFQKNPGAGVSKVELSNLLSDFKQDIINDVATQLDTMQDQRKKEEDDLMLAEYFPHCREKKHNYQYKPIASMNS